MNNPEEELRRFIKDTPYRYREGNRKRLEAIKRLCKTGPILLSDGTWIDAGTLIQVYLDNRENQVRVLKEMGFNEPLGELEAEQIIIG